MLLLETLGRIRLADADGREIDRLMRQPKRLGLLAYLASPSPGTWHRRDVLLGVFWPELDAGHARTALRNALHVLRQHLPAGTIRTRGDDEISIDPASMATDAALLEHDVSSGRWAETLARYDGDYLRGLYIRDAELFERWLDDERRRMSALARRAGLTASESLERSGDMAGAADTLQRVANLDPHDESTLRRMIAIYDRSGDRARALAAYERFRIRLAEDLSAEPSAETIAEIDRIRSRRVSVSPAAPEPVVVERPSTLNVAAPAGPPAPAVPGASSPAQWRRSRWLLMMLGTAASVGIVAAGLRANAPPRANRLVILPTNNTAAESLAYIGSGVGEDVALRLRGIGGLQTVHASGGFERTTAATRDPRRIAEKYTATSALQTTLSTAGDSLVIVADLIDLVGLDTRSVGRYAFVLDDVRDVASRIAARTAAELVRGTVFEQTRMRRERAADPESYRLTMQGWHKLLSEGDSPGAKELFNRAVSLDPENERAVAGLSSVWSSLAVTWGVEWPVGSQLAELAAMRAMALDSTDGTPLMNLAVLRGLESHRVSDAEPGFAKAIMLDPGNPELYAVRGALYRHAWQWDRARDAIRIARQLDPLSPALAEREAAVEMCRSRPREALKLYLAEISLDESRPTAHRGAARAFAGLGQWKEALEELHLSAPELAAHDDPNSGSLESRYWALSRRLGRAQLATLEERGRNGWVAPVQLAIAHIAAGDVDTGMSILEREVHSGDPGLYRLPCQVQMDAVRDSPRYKAILAALPRWEP